MTPDPRVPLSDAPKVLERLREIQEQAAKAAKARPGSWVWDSDVPAYQGDGEYAQSFVKIGEETWRPDLGNLTGSQMVEQQEIAEYIATANPQTIAHITKEAASLIESLLEERTKLRAAATTAETVLGRWLELHRRGGSGMLVSREVLVDTRNGLLRALASPSTSADGTSPSSPERSAD